MINDPITSTNYCHPIYKILRFFSFFNYKINVGIVIGWTNRIDPKKKKKTNRESVGKDHRILYGEDAYKCGFNQSGKLPRIRISEKFEL